MVDGSILLIPGSIPLILLLSYEIVLKKNLTKTKQNQKQNKKQTNKKKPQNKQTKNKNKRVPSTAILFAPDHLGYEDVNNNELLKPEQLVSKYPVFILRMGVT